MMSHLTGKKVPPCVMCMKPATKQCSGCHLYWYCDVQCQRKHWKVHKGECGKIKEIKKMTPKQATDELEAREQEYHEASKMVSDLRARGYHKMVWLTRCGENMGVDISNAMEKPEIQHSVDSIGKSNRISEASLSTLFQAVEGVSHARTIDHFNSMKIMKEKLVGVSRIGDDVLGLTSTGRRPKGSEVSDLLPSEVNDGAL